LVLKGNKYSMKLVAEKETEGRVSRGDHYSSDHEYTVSYWKGGGEIKDKSSRSSKLFEIKSREFHESDKFPPLAEAIIRFGMSEYGWDELKWRPVIKDEKRVVDLVLKQIFSEIEKAESAGKGKYPLATVTPKTLNVLDMVERGLIEEDRRLRLGIVHWDGRTVQFSTELSFPRNSLLLAKDAIANCSAAHNDCRGKPEDQITGMIDVELLRIHTSNPEPDKCVSEVRGNALIVRQDSVRERLEIKFDIPGLCSTQILPKSKDSIEDAICILEIHESMIRKIMEIAGRGRDKHLGTQHEQLELKL